jgi:hypothetical protein
MIGLSYLKAANPFDGNLGGDGVVMGWVIKRNARWWCARTLARWKPRNKNAWNR